jgi:Domain of unknown function (DUF397)
MAEYDRPADWSKSSMSGGDCVEVRIADNLVHVRDTKNRGGAVLTFSHTEWEAFLFGVRRGEFDVTSQAPG